MSKRVLMEGIYYEENFPDNKTDPDLLYFIQIDGDKCIGCEICQKYCPTGTIWGNRKEAHTIKYKETCIYCGQCLIHCPVNAIYECQSWLPAVTRELKQKTKKLIAMPAPSVRYALGDCFGLELGAVTTQKMRAALTALGFHHCWDTEFGADVAVWEEGDEFVERLMRHIDAPLPQLTSCCPGWHQYVELYFPELIEHLSTAKPPICMLGTLSKTYGADKLGYNRAEVFTVSIMPCTAKKYEGMRADLWSSGYQDIDATIDTRELAFLIKQAGLDFNALDDAEEDGLMGKASAGGKIFGVTSGVITSLMRYVYEGINKKPMPAIKFTPVEGMPGVKEAELVMGSQPVKVAVVDGARRFKQICTMIKEKRAPWQAIEFMTCPGGCINGGGQPIIGRTPSKQALSVQERTKAVCAVDAEEKLKAAQFNPQVQALYRDFLGEIGGNFARQFLHRSYIARSRSIKQLKEQGDVNPRAKDFSNPYYPFDNKK